MKTIKIVLFLIGFSITNLGLSQVTAGDCDDHVNICSDDNFSIDPNGFGNVDELGDGFTTGLVSNPTTNPGSNGNMGCLLSGELNSTWMVITVASSGALEFSFGEDDPTGMSFNCYDWIMWPYDPATTCADIQNNILPPVACNWNGICEGFTGMANTLPPGADISNFEAALNVNAGDQFIICFSNFSSAVTNVPLTFYSNSGSAGVSCSPVWVNDETICEGECVNLTANGGSNYTWSPTNGLTPTMGQVVNACPPSAGTWNYVVSGATPDGPAGDTATVIVLPSTDPACSVPTPCSMTSLTAIVGPCAPGDVNQITGTVVYDSPPLAGMLIVEDCQGNGDTLMAPFGTQFDFVFDASADGVNCTITAYFTENPSCTINIQENYQLPCPCNTTSLIANIGPCTPGDINQVTGTIMYDLPPATGMLIVEDCQGNGDTLMAPFGTQFDFVFDASADGANCTITAYFTDDPACTINIQETYQQPCQCSVDAGIDITICIGEQAVLSATGTDTYSWDQGLGPGQMVTDFPTVTTEYVVTGSMNFGCAATDTVTVFVNQLPPVNAGVDQTICAGDSVVVNGSGANTYLWDNGVVDGVYFFPVSTITLITMGTDVNLCENTDTIIITVNPMDDSSFEYNDSTFCVTSANPVLNIMGLQNGSFLASPAGLDIDPVTGSINVNASVENSYTVYYTTNGQCPTTSTYPINIVNTVMADFSFGDYCWNDTDPVPTYINGGVPGIFSANSPDLNIDPASGEIDLSMSLPGIYTITNEVNIPGCSIGQFQEDVEIFDLPSAVISGGGTVCAGSQVPDIQIDLAGSGDWIIDYKVDGVMTMNTTTSSQLLISGGLGFYELVLVSDNITGCSDSVFNQSAAIVLEQIPVLQPIQDIVECEGVQINVPAFVSNVPGTVIDWVVTNGNDVGNGLAGTGNIPSFSSVNGSGSTLTASIEVTPSSPFGCIGNIEIFDITISPIPQVNVAVNYSTQCVPATAVFTNTTSNGSQTSLWSLGDGSTNNVNGTISHVYNSDGCFNVSLTVTDTIGCSNSINIVDAVCVEPSPTANFLFDPSITDISNTEIQFQNLSEDASSYLWDFGDNKGESSEENPEYIYDDIPNEYIISLVAINGLGCSDTAYSKIVVRDVLLYYIPNAFTPDNDEFNQTFQPVFTSGYDPFDYTFQVFDRWGELIFVSNNPNVGWDGRFKGNYVQDGVYVWRIEFKETMTDARHEKTGSVILVR